MASTSAEVAEAEESNAPTEVAAATREAQQTEAEMQETPDLMASATPMVAEVEAANVPASSAEDADVALNEAPPTVESVPAPQEEPERVDTHASAAATPEEVVPGVEATEPPPAAAAPEQTERVEGSAPERTETVESSTPPDSAAAATNAAAAAAVAAPSAPAEEASSTGVTVAEGASSSPAAEADATTPTAQGADPAAVTAIAEPAKAVEAPEESPEVLESNEVSEAVPEAPKDESKELREALTAPVAAGAEAAVASPEREVEGGASASQATNETPDKEEMQSAVPEVASLTSSFLQPLSEAEDAGRVDPDQFLSTAAYPSGVAPSHPSSDGGGATASTLLQDMPLTAATMAGLAASALGASAAAAASGSASAGAPQAAAEDDSASAALKQQPQPPLEEEFAIPKLKPPRAVSPTAGATQQPQDPTEASSGSSPSVQPRNQAVESGSFLAGPWKQAQPPSRSPSSPDSIGGRDRSGSARLPEVPTRPLSFGGVAASGEEAKLPLLQNSGLRVKEPDDSTSRMGGSAPSGPVPGKKRTSGYQAVSTEEVDTARAREGRSSSSSAGRIGLGVPEPAPRESVGHQRLSLRDQFNLDEINAVKLIQRYDANKNGVLEAEEVVMLLKDQNKGVAPKYSEVEWLMIVADKDQSQNISADEVLQLVKVWFAFKNMPSSVNSCITKYAPTDGPLLTVASFKAMLEDINDFMEVSREEASYVRALAQALGATEKLATRWQLRQAIAGWYLHVDREQTDGIQLAMHSVQESTELLRTMSGRVVEATAPLPMETAFPGFQGGGSGSSHRPAAATAAAASAATGAIDESLQSQANTGARIIFGLLYFIIGIILLDVAERNPELPTCNHDLNGLLWWRGFLIASRAILDCVYLVTCAGKAPDGASAESESGLSAKCIFHYFMIFLQSVYFVQGIFGAFAVIATSADACGPWIWNWCALVFVWVPLLFCACLCCVSVGLVARSLNSAHAIDRSFHE
mmetsp:Transcript_28782/g.66905  ORF Transcript_28782/g.66905 Transcript_28782/m.66905 type:complete len:983 (-) Transcript_28782:83-3031(-)